MSIKNKEIWQNNRTRMTYYEEDDSFIVEVQERVQTSKWGSSKTRVFEKKYYAIRYLKSGNKKKVG